MSFEIKVWRIYVILIFHMVKECVGHSFVDAAHFIFLRDVWIRTQRAAEEKMFMKGFMAKMMMESIESNNTLEDKFPYMCRETLKE
jgi:hypothetical protein